MMNYTENYNLKKPEYTAVADIADLNENADILDSALKALEEQGTNLEEIIDSLSNVAESGDYEDLLNKPTSLPANGGNADTVNGVKFHPKNIGTLGTVSKPWLYAFESGDDYNCYVKNTGELEVGNSDKLGGLTASKYRGNPNFVYANQNGGDLNNFKTEFQGFVFNMTNKPSACSYGFLNVDYFDGTGFAPSEKGVVRQTYMDWKKADLCFVRYYIAEDNAWTSWTKIGGNADTLEGYTYDDIVSNAVDEVGFNGVVKNSFSGTAVSSEKGSLGIKHYYTAKISLGNINKNKTIASVCVADAGTYFGVSIDYHFGSDTLIITGWVEEEYENIQFDYNVLTFY